MGIDDADPDVNACLGDLYSRSSHQEDAKKCYDKIVAKVLTSEHTIKTLFAGPDDCYH